MPKKSSVKKASPKKDFFYYLPLITAIVVNLFWGMFGLVMLAIAAGGALYMGEISPRSPVTYVFILPLLFIFLFPISFILVVAKYIRGLAKPLGSFFWLNIFYFCSLLIYCLFLRVFVPVGLVEMVALVLKTSYMLVVSLLWLLSVLLSGLAVFLSKRKLP